MARIRTIKPDFFKHEGLFDAEQESRLPLRVAFAGIWTICDREGRFEWRPRAIKTDVLPYDDVDFPRVLDALATRGFLVRYRVDGKEYGLVPGFARHQVVNGRESASVLPAPPQDPDPTGNSTRDPRVNDASATRHDPAHGEGKGREGERKGKEGAATHASAHEADRVTVIQDRIIAALGLKGREINTSGTYVVGGMGIHDLPIRLAIWEQSRLTDDQIIMAITAAVGRERQKDPAWQPKSVNYFDGKIADFAKDLAAGKPNTKSETPPVYADPELAAEDAALRAEFAALTSRKDEEANQRRRELAALSIDIKQRASQRMPRQASGR